MTSRDAGPHGFSGSVWSDLRHAAFTHGWMDAGTIRTRYLVSGDQERPPLLFLHGTGGHLEAFSRNIAAHAERFHTWAIDMVGHGWSDLSSGPVEIADYARHVVAFLDAAGIERVALSGVSLGGWVATRIAVDHPDRVSALVLNTPGGSRADPKVMHTIRQKTTSAVDEVSWDTVRKRLEFLVADPAIIHDDLVATRLAMYDRPEMREAMHRVLVLQDAKIRARNLITEQEYGSVSAPTLVVWTSHDPTAPPEEGQRIASMIPGASFFLMDGCGHWPQFEAPERFNELQIGFLSERLLADLTLGGPRAGRR